MIILHVDVLRKFCSVLYINIILLLQLPVAVMIPLTGLVLFGPAYCFWRNFPKPANKED